MLPDAAVGTPCIPSPELSASFAGFQFNELTVDEGNAACGNLVCLVNHLQGRTTCPYGQNSNGNGPPPAAGCTVPGTGMPVTPNAGAMGQGVLPQCLGRTASTTVYCSCRCADENGNSDGPFCTCPAGYSCTQVVPELVAGDPKAGAYCIVDGTEYDATFGCSECQPGFADCGTVDAGALGVFPGGGATTYTLDVMHIDPKNAQCLSRVLPVDSMGRAQCDVLVVLPTGDSCAAHPGLSAADPGVAASVRSSTATMVGLPVCVLPQLTGSCPGSSEAGWCYFAGSTAPNGCPQAIEFSASGMPPSGAVSWLACP
jgi:hypothetical protein